jgi:putative flippase GtrA
MKRPTDMKSAGALLRSAVSGSSLTGQGARYAMSGVLVALVYLLTTTFLAVVVGLPFEAALPIGFVLALSVHFTLQRLFVWVHHEEFALPFRHQARRYLMVVVAQYVVTAASTVLLPGALGLPTEVVYLITALLLASANFLLFRNVVFHPEQSSDNLSALSQ